MSVPVSMSASRRGRMPLPLALSLVGINLLWGGSSLAAKIALGTAAHPGVPPMTLAFARFACASLLMYGVARLLKINLAVSRKDWGRFWAMGIVGLAFTYLLSYAGIQHTSVSDASLLIATEPVFLAILAFAFLHERMSQMKVAGIAAGLAGVWLIINGGMHLRPFSGMVLGDLLITLSLAFEAGSSILGKGLVARYPPISVMTYQMLSGAIALAPFAVVELLRAPGINPVQVFARPAALWSLAYLALPCTVLAYTVWFTILDKRDAGEMSVFLFLQPIVGTLLGAYFFHEPITAFTISGAVLVLLGIGLINRPPPVSLASVPPPSA